MAKAGKSENGPSVLAFERKLDVSDGLFFAGSWGNREHSSGWIPIAVHEKSVRGTIGNRMKTKKGEEPDPAKIDAKIENPNPQTVDTASLPADCDTLRLSFTLRALGGIGQPSACNDMDYQGKLRRIVDAYRTDHGMRELSRRYACNLANGRFLWRNRVGAEQAEVKVELLKEGIASQAWIFDALAFSLDNFAPPPAYASAIAELAEHIGQGLLGARHVLLRVSAFVRLGDGQEIFPSQEMIMKTRQGKYDKSKTLYKVGEIAGMHSQKLGNAVRTIDDWYPDAAGQGPIAVEPYGAVTSRGHAYRQPKKEKMDFYTLLDNWLLRGQEPSLENQHFVMAVLIRGGVFGAKGDDKESGE